MKKLTQKEKQLIHTALVEFLDYKDEKTAKMVEKIYDKILGE